MQNHGLPEQIEVNEKLREYSKKFGIKTVITNDVHYINKDDSLTQDVLMCVQMGKTIDDPNRLKFSSDEFYLKTAICYVLKNPPVGGICYNAYDYPWGSGALYFRNAGEWCSPNWISNSASDLDTLDKLGVRGKRALLKSKVKDFRSEIRIVNGMVFPGEYVAYEIVERIFKTHKSFNFFLCRSKEEDIESRGGELSRLSIPIQEMRQHRNDICLELFNTNSIRALDTQQRLKLARTLRKRFNSSLKQICRLCGLIHNEVKGHI